MVPRPPALPQKQSQTITAAPSIAGFSRSSATAPLTSRGSISSGKAGSRPSQPRFQSEPATEHPLEFTLPDPSAPPPVHFLRSQENLLGKAGRVGGITTALPQPRGSTPSNPILIDDDDDTPMIGRRNGSKSRETSEKPIDPIKLVQPTDEEIVSVLVGQRDIFPVLESILKLIAKGAQPKSVPSRPTGFERRPLSPTREWTGPPTKKRKLNRVPAGASDWDVPFPFAHGEGPNAYQQNWERDRGKQLIAELIKLIKVASRKAAAKKYFARQKGDLQETGVGKDVDTSKNIMGYYRPETALYDPQRTQVGTGVVSKGENLQLEEAAGQPNLKTLSGSSLQPAIPLSMPSLQGEFQESLDQLMSCFMESSDFMSTRPATDISGSPNLTLPPTTMFDAWMNILDTFPLDSAGTGVGPQGPFSETPLSARSTPGINDFGQLSIPPDLDASLNSMRSTPPVATPSTITGDNLNSQDLFSSSLFDLTSISPTQPSTPVQDIPNSHSLEFNALASTSNPTNFEPMFFIPSAAGSNASANPGSGISEDLTRSSSPLPSASSESQAMTPASASWDVSSPDIFSGSSRDGQGEELVDFDLERRSFGGMDLNLEPTVVDKGKAKEVVHPLTTTKITESAPQFGSVTQSVLHAILSTKTRDELLACLAGSASSITPPTLTTKPIKRSKETDDERSARLRRKEDTIRRAKERRQEIQESLDNIKRQLWETTIEQAALVHLTQKLEVDNGET